MKLLRHLKECCFGRIHETCEPGQPELPFDVASEPRRPRNAERHLAKTTCVPSNLHRAHTGNCGAWKRFHGEYFGRGSNLRAARRYDSLKTLLAELAESFAYPKRCPHQTVPSTIGSSLVYVHVRLRLSEAGRNCFPEVMYRSTITAISEFPCCYTALPVKIYHELVCGSSFMPIVVKTPRSEMGVLFRRRDPARIGHSTHRKNNKGFITRAEMTDSGSINSALERFTTSFVISSAIRLTPLMSRQNPRNFSRVSGMIWIIPEEGLPSSTEQLWITLSLYPGGGTQILKLTLDWATLSLTL